VGVRIVILLLLLALLVGVVTFWYWFFKIRKPPQPPPIFPEEKAEKPPEKVVPQITIPPSLFAVDNTLVLSATSPTETRTSLQHTVREPLTQDQFLRVVIKDEKMNKIFGLRDFFETLLVRAPEEFYQNLENDFTFFVYSQPEGNRIGLAVKVKNATGLTDLLKSWEPNMENNLRPFFELIEEKIPSAIVPYFRNASNVSGYVGPNFRYQSITRQDLGICYLISGDYFVFTSSWKSMEKTIAKLAIPTKPVELTRELKLGDSGNEVELLQVWLRQEPLVYPEGKVTGYFGKLTQEAVIRFQEKYAAEILAPQGFSKGTGIVDSYTRIKLNELYGKSGIIPTVPEITSDLRYGDHGNEVKLLQTWLAKDKEIYPEGKISGWFGYATQRAVIRFQEKYASEILTPQGLSRGSGIVDALTRKKLNQLFGNK
jgi:peptidoglycan hydrolase-like protein with peptidoglycan-binding domain